MIKEKLKIVEKKLLVKLEEIRASHQHRGVRGTASESVFRDFLREYLPPENRIGEGEVIDTNENVSTQLDVIITNEYQPYINDLKEPGLFIIEGVSCVGEVKSNLNSNDVDTLIQSCIRYKNLSPEIQKGAMIYGNESDIKRFVSKRPYFIFAFESQLTIDTISKKISNYYSENNTPINMQIDGVFCLDRGAIINFGDGKGSLQYSTMEKRSLPGIHVTRRDGSEVLLDLLSWLSASMQKISMPTSPLISYLVKNVPMNPDAP
ncbi:MULTISPECIES: DUF6602 domain-containing protein [Vibrio]|uniref:DUF6602 domain-containing protein n=1 Tax=Vibrio TaxID=662 RepID=UPI000A1ECA86|nr:MULTISPECIES: DUF6602 domain-containing protein [Vibrio]ELB2172868.1 hypothetical protein [Vibrio parahaemolyticus]MBD6946025.1 hypothetical protein [Vibrio parahaemolyticus]MBD6957940.1 hypothetical protein [Vibrio parahaemolyticus]MBD6975954.1 hypothetical protein [Vibrio parahaemolyticus]MBD6991017.1 hypothetical protein [Vibrio parahaemolyticus]